MVNKLYYGDNLRVLRDHVASESVDRGKFRKLQILTVEDLLNAQRRKVPFVDSSSFKKTKCETATVVQSELDI